MAVAQAMAQPPRGAQAARGARPRQITAADYARRETPRTLRQPEANQDFDLVVLPNRNHGYDGASAYMMRHRWDFFVRWLHGTEPPKEYQVQGQTPAQAPPAPEAPPTRAAPPRADVLRDDTRIHLDLFAMPVKVGRRSAWQSIKPTAERKAIALGMKMKEFAVATNLYYTNVSKP
jgi:hypothetical protein